MSAKSGTVLVIDDDRSNLQILEAILNSDYEIISALGGAEGVRLADSEKPDLIMLDVMMPGMDGYEAFSRLKDNPSTRSIPVIFITASDDEEDEAKGLEMGAIDFVTKPSSPAIVRARVKNHIELKRYRDLLQNLADLDKVTALPSRSHFDRIFEQECQRCIRDKTAMALVVMELDFFQEYCGHYGEAAGDECLQRVASALGAALHRPGDFLARYADVVFACVLPGTKGFGTQAVAESLQSSVLALRIPHEKSPVADVVTLSLGLISTDLVEGLSQEHFLEQAGGLLRKAKEAGGNRLEVDSL